MNITKTEEDRGLLFTDFMARNLKCKVTNFHCLSFKMAREPTCSCKIIGLFVKYNKTDDAMW